MATTAPLSPLLELMGMGDHVEGVCLKCRSKEGFEDIPFILPPLLEQLLRELVDKALRTYEGFVVKRCRGCGALSSQILSDWEDWDPENPPERFLVTGGLAPLFEFLRMPEVPPWVGDGRTCSRCGFEGELPRVGESEVRRLLDAVAPKVGWAECQEASVFQCPKCGQRYAGIYLDQG